MSTKSNATVRYSAATQNALDHPANRKQREYANPRQELPQHMWVKITTITKEDKIESEMFWDNMHVGTMMRLNRHMTWANFQGYRIEIDPATAQEIEQYVYTRSKQLQEKVSA